MSPKNSLMSFSFIALQFVAVLLWFMYIGELDYITAILLGISGLGVLRLTLGNMLLGRRIFEPLVVFLLLSLFVITPSYKALLAVLCLVRSCWYVGVAFRRELSFDYVFRAGLYLSLGAIFAFECLFLIPSFLIGLWWIRRSWREIFVSFVGLCLPLLAYPYVLWGVFNEPFLGFFQCGFESVGFLECQCVNIYDNGLFTLVNLALFALVYLVAIALILKNLTSIRRRARRLLVFFFWMSLSCIIICVFSSSSAIYAIMAVPLSIIISRIFTLVGRKLAFGVYFILLLAVAVSQLHIYLGF